MPTLNEFNAQYSQWLKDKPITSGAQGSCDIDPNKNFAHYCGDDKCYGLEKDEFLKTQTGCATNRPGKKTWNYIKFLYRSYILLW